MKREMKNNRIRYNEKAARGITCSKLLRCLMMLLWMGVNGVWGQTIPIGIDYGGFYFIASYDAGGYNASTPANNYYLCPATLYYDGDGYQSSGVMPYLTTYKTGKIADSVWKIEFVETIDGVDYYRVIHHADGTYLTLNDSKTDNVERLRLHLQSDFATNGDALFYFTVDATRNNSMTICPKNDASGRSLNPAGNNYNNKNATNGRTAKINGVAKNVGGIIGIYKKDDVRSVWCLEDYTKTPTITYTGTGTVIISSSENGVTLRYTTDGSTPVVSSEEYTAPIQLQNRKYTIKAIAVKDGIPSRVAMLFIDNREVTSITSLSQIDYDEGRYRLESDIAAAGAGLNMDFKGELDGNFHTISGLTSPLFSSTNDALIKNINLKDVTISQSSHAGAITGVAGGYTRIYNCGILPSDNKFENETSSIASTNGYCGGLVGWLKDDSRVVNCFSYANIAGGTDVAGIVGHNETASNTTITGGGYAGLKTAVVNCMFYGNITSGTNRYPVYGGEKMLNTGTEGINNYDFYRAEASLGTLTDYNCSWPASEENLTRFEYYRYLLNANRELCGWWVKSDVAPSTLPVTTVQAIEKDASLMAKWVLDPSIAPYPILKTAGKYPSVINRDQDRAWHPVSNAWKNRTSEAQPYEGKQLKTLSVMVKAGSHHSASDVTLTLPVLDMDTLNCDYNYGKIQLPYYNEVFGNPNGATWSAKYGDNYTAKVVTGWKVTDVSGGTEGTFTEDWETGYDFADRHCTDKDKHRVFAQGGFYYVPYDVDALTIEAYWGDAYYLSNAGGSYERVNLSSANAGSPFEPAGAREATTGNGQTIYTTTIQDILQNKIPSSSLTVYDCAIVLVGNHQYRNSSINVHDGARKPFTLMSVDLDFDNEPDYCLEWQVGQNITRVMINPVRFDFLPIVELGVAMKEDGSKNLYAMGKLTPWGHFEVTETSIVHFGQFEYDQKDRVLDGPVILNNGTYDQIVRGSEVDDDQHITYFLLGGHVKMPSFTPGAHVKTPKASRHCAVTVLGGEFGQFYLSGNYNAGVTANKDNPHCYMGGGKMGFVASAAKEQIDGNVFWKIDHAYIGEFYGGGINADKPVTGNIDITIDNSLVAKFCGGPQFGDMASGKTVTTHATGTTFGVFYGAGNGGTCYSQYNQTDATNGTPNSYNWENGGSLKNYTALTYRNQSQGYHAKYELEMINTSSGTENNGVCRTYMYAAQFATTNTGNVTNTLTDCTILTNFYGAGNLGGVNGNVTSTLNGETVVEGNVFGAGFSAQIPSVDVYPKSYTAPVRNENTAVITPPTYAAPTTYYWTNEQTLGTATLSTSSPAALNPHGDGINYLYTEIPLNNLGSVSGTIHLAVEESCHVKGDVYGGGDESNVVDSTNVHLTGGIIDGDVYGGGRGVIEVKDNEGNITTKGIAATVGTATVELNKGVADDAKGCVVGGSIFGCNNQNGTPLGNVTVHVYATQNAAATRITNVPNGDQTAKVKGRYDVKAVYGGGNLAAYIPTDLANSTTNVIIDGCDSTSIRQVYGGGNAASTPATNVVANATFEVEELFGGGNGKDSITVNGVKKANPGANVGFKDYSDKEDVYNTKEIRTTDETFLNTYVYGSGKASVNIYGGLVHRVFGGSNTKGNVRETAVTMLEDMEGCEFCVDEAYGGGKSAPMDAEAKLLMACIPGLKAAYGGAEAADIQGNVTLNITNGTFERVFGGNNISGTIWGSITVNIEETGCRPIIIGELYGGGNKAPYSIYGYEEETDSEGNSVWVPKKTRTPGVLPYHDPQVNVKMFTSIGSVYGGGYGANAVMVGNPHVNINVVEDATTTAQTRTDNAAEYAGDTLMIEGHIVVLPAHKKGKMGAIRTVFGGGNAAEVIGDTYVNVGTLAEVEMETLPKVEGQTQKKAVAGADIRGNVYGGGNNAKVTGNTHVQIGK